MKKFSLMFLVLLMCLVPFFPVPAQALDGEVFLNKTLSINDGTSSSSAYALTTSLSHNKGAIRPYVKGNVNFLSGMQIVSKKYKLGTAVDITKTITGNVGYEVEMFPDESEKSVISVGTDIALGNGFTGRIGYEIKAYPDSTQEKVYAFGLGYKFKVWQ